MDRSRPASLALLAALVAAVFGPALWGGQSFAHRDAAGRDYPQLKLASDEWGAGRVPLWNPYQNIGLPLLAQRDSGVLYPGKLIFALPMRFALAYNLYIVGHLALAAVAAWWLARRWGASTTAAGIAGVAYSFGGIVLLNYAQAAFLIGAAWLPAAFRAMDCALAERSSRWAIALGGILALMVLGGDSQMAYLAGLTACGYAATLWWVERHSADRPNSAAPRRSIAGIARSRLGSLSLACVTATVLASAQLVPSVEWATLSERAAGERGDRDHSLGPWRLPEFVWPNVTGKPFPIHQRTIDVLGGDRVWTPTFYLGSLPLWLAVAAFGLRASDPRRRFLSWLAVAAILFSLGDLGGVDFVFDRVLPGYAAFDYPARWLVPGALAISLLAAYGWDEAWGGGARRARAFLGWASVASLTLLTAALTAVTVVGVGWASRIPTHPQFGPYDPGGGLQDLVSGLAQAAVASLAALWLFDRHRLGDGRRRIGLEWAALAIAAADVAWANGWAVPFAPEADWRQPSRLAAVFRVGEGRPSEQGRRPFRVYRARADSLFEWRFMSSLERPREVLWAERDSLFANYNFAAETAVLSSTSSSGIAPRGWGAIADELGSAEQAVPGDVPAAAAAWLDALGARYWIIEDNLAIPSRRLPNEATVSGMTGLRAFENASAMPRAWIARSVEYARLNPAATELCRVVRYEPGRVEIECDLSAEGLVVLSDLDYPGWRLEAQSENETAPRTIPILRTNEIMRGAWLPAGKTRLTYSYRPVSFVLGAAISGLGWSVLLVACARWWRRKRASVRL